MLFVLYRTSSARVIRLQHVTWRRQSVFWCRSAPSCSTGRWPRDRFLRRSKRHTSHRFWRRSAWILPMSARTGQSPICRWCRSCWSVWLRSSWWATWRRPACFRDCSRPSVPHHRRKPQFWGSWLSSCGRSIPVTWRSWRCSTYEPRSIPWITQLCCVGWAWCTLDCAVFGWSYAVRPLRLLWVGSSDFVIRYPAGLGPWADSVPAVYRQPMEAHRRAWPHSSSVCCLHTDLPLLISIWCPAAAGEGFEMPWWRCKIDAV